MLDWLSLRQLDWFIGISATLAVIGWTLYALWK